MPKLIFSMNLAKRADNCQKISLPDGSFQEILLVLEERYPSLQSIVLTPDKNLSPNLVYFINGVDVRMLDQNQLLNEEDEIHVLLPMAGG